MLEVMKKITQLGLAGALIVGVSVSGNAMHQNNNNNEMRDAYSLSAVDLLEARESENLDRVSQQDVFVPDTITQEPNLGKISVTSKAKPKPKPKPPPVQVKPVETIETQTRVTEKAPLKALESDSPDTNLDEGEVVGIPSQYVAAGRTGITATPSDPSKIRVATVTDEDSVRSQIISDAKAGLGTPYVWGGTSPTKGWDCSGYVQHIFNKSGIPLNRVDAWANFRQVKAKDAKPGDLVVQHNGAHVGIYAGNGKMYHAANPSRGTIYSSAHHAPPTFYKMIIEK